MKVFVQSSVQHPWGDILWRSSSVCLLSFVNMLSDIQYPDMNMTYSWCTHLVLDVLLFSHERTADAFTACGFYCGFISRKNKTITTKTEQSVGSAKGLTVHMHFVLNIFEFRAQVKVGHCSLSITSTLFWKHMLQNEPLLKRNKSKTKQLCSFPKSGFTLHAMPACLEVCVLASAVVMQVCGDNSRTACNFAPGRFTRRPQYLELKKKCREINFMYNFYS